MYVRPKISPLALQRNHEGMKCSKLPDTFFMHLCQATAVRRPTGSSESVVWCM